jgi:hypothetical protein
MGVRGIKSYKARKVEEVADGERRVISCDGTEVGVFTARRPAGRCGPGRPARRDARTDYTGDQLAIEQAKRNILGLNAARIFNLEPKITKSL